MSIPTRITAVLLIAALTATGIFAFGQDGGKPVALAGKSKTQARPETVKKPFPWLLAGGVVAAGIVVVILLSKNIKDSIQPNVSKGNIQAMSSPSGARISLDDKDTGLTTDTTLRNISAGRHTIALTLAGYDEYVQSVTVEAGRTAEFAAARS
jgi:hypothetical protein